ncbi:hypothetical protein ACFE04_008572 [Oxalis oulophora]
MEDDNNNNKDNDDIIKVKHNNSPSPPQPQPQPRPDSDSMEGETGGVAGSGATRLKITFKMSKSPSTANKDAPTDAHHTLVESRSYKRKKPGAETFEDPDEAKSPIFKQAEEEFVSNLPTNYPSFKKTLVRSNCSYGYWMHIPMRFCKMYMPRHDTRFFLESEDKQTYTANYIAERTALSGGWKAFATAHQLNEGDVLIFHLVEPYKFKVYVVRPNDSAQADAVSSDNNQISSEHVEKRIRTRRSPPKNLEIVPVEASQDNGHVSDQFGNDGSDSPQIIKSNADFKVKSIDDFKIIVNGVTIDSELSDLHRTKYYELCVTQKSFLHDHLLNGISSKMAAEITAQTVNIADDIRESNFFSSQADYIVWDQTLTGFELLGMDVGFLRTRLNRLMSLYSESEEAKVLQRCREVEIKKSRADEEMESLKLKISELKQSIGKLDSEMENLKVNVDKHERLFQKEVDTPW